jgi:uncharacterized protein with FMN-binding domain
MRRVIPAVLLTAAGFYFVWQFKPGADTDIVTADPAPPPAVVTSTPSTSGGTPTVTKTTTGTSERSEFGNIQVRVTFTDDKITAVQFLRLPSSPPSRQAGPILVRETLRAQSANIDTVSGATQTSESYIKSLQAAIDAKGA